jgi:hypothetical protein
VSLKKNVLRIQKNVRSIESIVENLILDSDRTFLVSLHYLNSLKLCSAKEKLKVFLEKIRVKFRNVDYIALSMIDNQMPVHKLVIGVDAESSALLEMWGEASEVEVLAKENAYMHGVLMGEFYEYAAISLPFSLENSKCVKSKLFHRNRRMRIKSTFYY